MLPPRSASDRTWRSAARVRSGPSSADAEVPGDPVGGQEPDAEHAGQLVGPFGHDAVCPVAVGLVDPWRQVGQAVGCEQQVEAARGAQLVPGPSGLADRGPFEARSFERRVGIVVDGVEHEAGAVAIDKPGGALGPDAVDPDQVRNDRVGVGVRGRQRVRLGGLHLRAVAAVLHPRADDAGALALLEVDQRADQRDRRPVGTGRLDHRPPGLGVGEPDAPDGHLGVERAHAADIRRGAGGIPRLY